MSEPRDLDAYRRIAAWELEFHPETDYIAVRLLKLAKNNPYAKAVMDQWRAGVYTRSEALMVLAEALVADHDRLIGMLHEYVSRQGLPKVYVVDKKPLSDEAKEQCTCGHFRWCHDAMGVCVGYADECPCKGFTRWEPPSVK